MTPIDISIWTPLLTLFNFNPSMDKPNKVWDKIIQPFTNLNGGTLEV